VTARIARLSVLLARDAPVGVILRRGPSKQVLCARWRTDTDAIEEGQWLAGRIYENRCDLSPTGDKLVYFAAKWKGEHETWTAVSRPPWLTALIFWPKGDAWGGGGLFETEKRIALNHPGHQLALAGNTKVPRGVTIVPFGPRPGAGEDGPIWHARLVRDGWKLTAAGGESEYDGRAHLAWKIDPPTVYAKAAPRDRGVTLELRIHGVGEKNGPWYVMEHALVAGGASASLGKTSFADFDHAGHVVFALGGKLLRLRRPAARTLDVAAAELVADLTDRRFVARASPVRARQWR